MAVLAAWTLVLTWCNNSTQEISVEVDTPVTGETTLKQSLDMGELIWAIEKHFPKSYSYEIYDFTGWKVVEKWTHIYNRMDLWYITPEHKNIVDREVYSSSIEDWMIYTTLNVKYDDGRTGQVLFINNPETLEFVAANILWIGDLVTYQFSYDDVNSLTLDDIDSITKNNFPLSFTYTKRALDTNESSTWEFLYHEDTPHNLANITPDFPAIKESILNSSAIEDWMIYTHFNVTFDDNTTGTILYINDPETLNFVAATVEQGNNYINYQYAN